KNRDLVKETDELRTAAVAALLLRGDEILGEEPASVTFKEDVPTGATTNDYVRLAPYWWAAPTRTDGLRCIRGAGKMNPISDADPDAKSLSSMAGKVQVLGLAYFFTGDEKYAERAKYLLHVFFIDEKTKMNPHFEFSQLIMGRKSGGNIIDANPLM